ncbi:hypothetical protein KDW_61380 [Dictyobacter vulcani]|uniref:Uncharacterized protein n=1 Tax=Dictyobacter vulcani TaxID=2607529 RepID=A0A5J4L3C6_9CHLR|nr:DUF5691 domain-containing protein [Dictyobacter vulcani]GER91976.1 hypothetical protein KDW_61380 [Dictyobacter vulcani]
MEAFLKNAVVGTDRLASPLPATETELDTLTVQLPTEQKERSLLLAAGAYAIYSQAGFAPPKAPKIMPQAAPETLRVCSATIAHRFEEMLDTSANTLLPEALHCLQAAQLRLPHALLLQSISYASKHQELQSAFLAVLGERGDWLSQFNPEWSWIHRPKQEDPTRAELEALWEEGNLEQRENVLSYLRIKDPDTARDWLQSVWKQEKAEVRERFLDTLVVNISNADQVLLEQALKDRSQRIREKATQLFAYLPETPQMQRIMACADSIFVYKQNELTITLPTVLDSIDEFVPALSEKSSLEQWSQYMLMLVPPPHWEEHLALTPGQFIEQLATYELRQELIESLMFSALTHQSINWYEPLLRWSIEHILLKTRQGSFDHYQNLLAALPEEQAEALLLPLVEHPNHWTQAVQLLPGPWSKKYSQHFIKTLQKYYAQESNTSYTAWTDNLPIVASAIHPSCFELAQGPWEHPEKDAWYIQHRKQQVQNMLALIEMRTQFLKEIK